MRHSLVVLAVVVGLGAGVPTAGAHRCYTGPCARRLGGALRAARRCLKPSRSCTIDLMRGVTCWTNGARVDSSGAGDAVTARQLGPTGGLCLTTVTRLGASFYELTYTRGDRSWRVRQSEDGVGIDCPTGKSDVYSAAYVFPRCEIGPGGFRARPLQCTMGSCP